MLFTPRSRNEIRKYSLSPWGMITKTPSVLGTCTTGKGPCTVAWGDNSSGVYTKEYEFVEMTDVLVEDFYKRRAAGEVFNNPMTKVTTIENQGAYGLNLSYDVYQWGCSPPRWYDWHRMESNGTKSINVLLGSLTYGEQPTIDTTGLANLAITEAYSKINSSDLLAWGTIREMDDTITGLGYILKKVYKIALAVKKKQVKQLLGELSLKELEQVYMNARYNLRPLYIEISNLIELFSNPREFFERKTFRGYSSASAENLTYGSVEVFNNGGTFFSGKVFWRKYVKRKVEVRSGVLCHIDHKPDVFQLLGCDLISETLWDAIPFSFIVDWFCNAGNLVAAWSPDYGVSKLASWNVTRDETFYSTTITGGSYSNVNTGTYKVCNPSYSVTPGVSAKTVQSVTRTVDPSLPILPTFCMDLDKYKILDLAIIVKNLLGLKLY